MPERRNTPSGILHLNKNSRRMKKKIYQCPALEVVDVHAESQLMTGSGISFGGSADEADWGTDEEAASIWAE